MTAKIANKAFLIPLFLVLGLGLRAQLKADFIASSTNGCTPLLVRFTDKTTGSPTQWKWDLGNGTVSYLKNPSALYFTPGQYSVKLVVKNATGEDSVTQTDYITVYAPPTVAFSVNVSNGCFPLPVEFTDQSNSSNGTIATWLWDFGDGFSTNLANPNHTYTASGNYNVTLRVVNSNNCIATISKPQFIQIRTGVNANFSHSNPNSCQLPDTIQFKNLSTGVGALTYKWLFGDGGTSTALNPSNTYTSLGDYTVQLISTNAFGCTDTITKLNEIAINKAKVDFTLPAKACQLENIGLINQSTPDASSYKWSFGDGSFSTDQNPFKSYAVAGDYTIKMAGNFGSCKDSIIKTISIKPKPRAAFISSLPIACSTPFIVNFTNQTVNGLTTEWNFGEGIFSNAPNPSYTYLNEGFFSVTQIASNADGCSDTLVASDLIIIKKPIISLNNLPDSGCAPFTKTFSATINAIDTVTSYAWDFGDGNNSTEVAPIHTYSLGGQYPVALSVTTALGCTKSVNIPVGIKVNDQPIAQFSATPTITCAVIPVVFTDLSTIGATSWLWDFGDGTTSTIQNPEHTYGDTGKFTVQLIARNGGCADTIRIVDYIQIYPPIAKFNVNNDCNLPFQKSFIDASIGADEWNWNFGDGTTSTLQNPVHQYLAKGTYEVSLKVKNYLTGCEFEIKHEVLVIDEKARFTSTDTSFCKGINSGFTSDVDVSVLSTLSWDWGDGSVLQSNVLSVNHTYTATGNYKVSLTVTDLLGCSNQSTKLMNLRINGPTANFTIPATGSCLKTIITFDDHSTGDGIHPIKTYFWQYGDQLIDTLLMAPFQHNYATGGNYWVKLIVADSVGCTDSFTLPAPLVISEPRAKFLAIDTLNCPNHPIAFTNQSTGPKLTYLWDFGDGTTSSDQHPIHAFTVDGRYTIALFITDEYGCTAKLERPNYIHIQSPIASFKMSDSASACPPLVVQFTDSSVNSISKIWDFGDGSTSTIDHPSHFYTSTGTFMVQLTITGAGGCTSSFKKSIVIGGPTGSFSYGPLKGCVPLKVDFNASGNAFSSIIWDFTDGNAVGATTDNIEHEYLYPGMYVPKIILIDENNCEITITGKDTIVASGVVANFNVEEKVLCDSGTIKFSETSKSDINITAYDWSFGDGTFSSSQVPTHQYLKAGLYYPKLKVTTALGCTDSAVAPTPVKVIASPVIDILTNANQCVPMILTAKGQQLPTDTSAISWTWNFNNGQSSTLQNPPDQQYATPGIYTISLKAINSSGCKGTTSKKIEAYPLPIVSAGKDTFICNKKGKTLQATGAAFYNWSPSFGLSCTNCASPIATPDSMTQYLVKGTTAYGCSATSTINVSVKYPFKMTFSRPDTVCKGENVRLVANGAYRYTWFPAGNLSNSIIANPMAFPDTTTNFRVIGYDENSCFSDTGFVLIKVYPIPTVEAGPDRTINIGSICSIVPTLSPDVVWWQWSPIVSLQASGVSSKKLFIKPNSTEQYTIKVKNAGGCTAEDRVTVFVICNNSNVFIPNTFSPNGDGANDVFYPRGSGLFTIKSFRIFNRWGQLVFEKQQFDANDAAAGWDGRFKGTALNADVFVYTIELICDNNQILVYKGNVALIL